MPDASGEMGRTRIWYPEVASTMDIAAELARRGAPHGTLVEAAHQYAGRGRLGRTWTAAPGTALLSSWLIRVRDVRDFGFSPLSPLVALAMIRAVRGLAPNAPVAFKWPNDVLVDGRKLAGILLSSRMSGPAAAVVAGIGVNVDPGSVPESVPATCLRAWAGEGTLDTLRSALARELDVVVERFTAARHLPDAERAELERLLAWPGVDVEVLEGERAVRGRIVGLERDGALRLQCPGDGSIRLFRAAEIARGPRTTEQDEPENSGILP